ncbi:SGNH/GDSL hydrolase family protein [Herbaspirillum sp. SJZ107]|uniref:SGNH/GDSL hydrolase family protein n=1 Tax=Herbaspirillum sp. SJZ107 TaxID=2572881 RepID=UPI001154448B|nr:SGNH/GDSL hydrolase family protein [Herbaspirillum sp. SJZ107]TQK10389.1 lysophospholipase L1-like esterase [Herbaspirillum sp. SJZ107]
MDKHRNTSNTTGPNGRRSFLRLGAAAPLALAAAPFAGPAVAQDRSGDLWAADRWVGTWGASPTGAAISPQPAPRELTNQTLRQIVHTSIGGNRVRVCFSNEFGTTPLTIGAAHVARRTAGSSIDPATGRVLTFGGQPSIVIPPGAPALSDPVDLDLPPLVDLAISIYLPQPATATTLHGSAFQTNYIVAGNAAGAPTLADASTTTSWHFLSGVSVWTSRAGAIVTLGDSITDGAVTTVDANRRWPDILSLRLRQYDRLFRLGVVNAGIGGNRLLNPGNATIGDFQGIGPLFGQAALARFDRDVLAQPGVEAVIVLLGVNDLGQPVSISPASEEVSEPALLQGYRQLIARAREKSLNIYGATITPFGDTTIAGYFTPAREAIRQAVNNWIRSSGEWDGVIDFDAAVRDPANPARMLPAYDSGDHLHPNDAGMVAMGQSIPLRMLTDILRLSGESDVARAALAA